MRRATVAARARPSAETVDRDRDRDTEAPSPSAEEPIPTLNWPPDSLSHSGDEDSFIDLASNSAKQSSSKYTLSEAWSGVNWADLMAAQGAFGTEF